MRPNGRDRSGTRRIMAETRGLIQGADNPSIHAGTVNLVPGLYPPSREHGIVGKFRKPSC